MRKEILLRVFNEADYILKNNTTIRQTAKHFCVSKSTVHYDLQVRLKVGDFDLWKKVKKLLKTNLNQRHIRGGNATKNKYEKLKKRNKK